MKRNQQRTEKQKAQRRADYQKCKDNSICLQCGDPSWKQGTAICVKHLKKQKHANELSVKKRAASGKCLRCENPIAPHHSSFCKVHAEVSAKKLQGNRAARIEKGLCRACGSDDTEGKVHCTKCRAYYGGFRLKYKNQILDHYGRECACCKLTGDVFLAIDHVNNNGAKHRKEKGQYGAWKNIVEQGFPDDYQILCHNCNMAKHILGQCPHQTQKNDNK